MGSYPVDAYKSPESSPCSCDGGNIASATEYNTDATCVVDHTTDSGFEGGDNGGEAAVRGIFEEAVVNLRLHMGYHPVVVRCCQATERKETREEKNTPCGSGVGWREGLCSPKQRRTAA